VRGKSGRVQRQEAEASPRRSTVKVAEVESDGDGEGSSVVAAAVAAAAAGVVGFMDWGFSALFSGVFFAFFFSLVLGRQEQGLTGDLGVEEFGGRPILFLSLDGFIFVFGWIMEICWAQSYFCPIFLSIMVAKFGF
jgi:hypothetical protein